MLKGPVTIAIKAARMAGAVIIRHMNRIGSIPVIEKGRMDFVTEVDRAAEAEIIKELKRSFPRHAFLAEESGAVGDSRHVWIIDPLDGTHNYIRGIPHFSVSIALTENGEPTHAVIYDPVRDELFTATKGGGAFHNDRRMRVADRSNLDGALLTTGFPYREHRHLDPQIAMTRALLGECEDIRRSGSAALDLAYVAAGRYDGYWEIGLKPWDMAAGILLVREAGGRCVDFSGGSDFMQTGNIIAANLKLTDQIVSTIAPHRTAALKK